MATMCAGVRPIMRLASRPTATGRPSLMLTATTDGSFRTMPRPRTYTSVLAVPRSTAMSRPMIDENGLSEDMGGPSAGRWGSSERTGDVGTSQGGSAYVRDHPSRRHPIATIALADLGDQGGDGGDRRGFVTCRIAPEARQK